MAGKSYRYIQHLKTKTQNFKDCSLLAYAKASVCLHAELSVLVGNTENTSHAGSSADRDATEDSIPYTTVIGGGIAGFIIVLLLVIIVLLMRLRYKNDTAVRRRTVFGKFVPGGHMVPK